MSKIPIENLSHNMRLFTLKDLVKIKNGKDHKQLKEGNIPILGSGGIMRFGNEAIYETESILLPRKGTLSNIQFSSDPFWTVDTLYYTEINRQLCDPFYLFNYLKILNLESLNTGTGVPSMTFDSYYNLKINLPSLAIQNRVSSILWNIERKIQLNKKINDNLSTRKPQFYFSCNYFCTVI
jgi:type I restriction enzyme S subunit